MDDRERLHDLPVADELYHMLYYLARIDGKRIRTLLARAIEDYGKKRGVYVSTKGAMIEVCPMCSRELTEKTVAGYLLKVGVWICAACHKTLVRERDEWLRKNRASLPARGSAHGPARGAPAGRHPAMRDSEPPVRRRG